MGLIGFLKKIFKRSDSIDAASMRIDAESINQSINQSLDHQNQRIISNKEVSQQPFISKDIEESAKKSSIDLEKESLKLGMAAGFAGRAIINIEDTLSRLESMVTTKDWINPKIEKILDLLDSLKDIISKHEENQQKRFETILDSISKISTEAKKIPEPERTKILTEVERIKKASLTPKMRQLIDVVRSAGEISYSELSQRLKISQDALRGLLSRTVKLTDKIERFERENKGWVRFKSNQSINQSQENSTHEIEQTEDLSDLP